MNTLFLALRVSTTGQGKKSTPAIKVAVAAVALSVAVMLAAIAIVLGFKEEITKKVLGFNPHITLRVNPALSHDEYLVNFSTELNKILAGTPYISQYSLTASAPAIFKTNDDFKGIYMKAASNDYMGDFLKTQIIEGTYPDFTKDSLSIVISKQAADQLQVKTGDNLNTYFITNEIFVQPLKIAGIYNSHFSSYDDIFAFGSLPLIQGIGKIESNQGTYINIYVDDFSKLSEYTIDLRQRLDKAYAMGQLPQYYDIETALSTGANFFSWLALLDTNVIVILALMTAVALITLISGMMILIVDKKRFISIMKALGSSNRQLRKIFVWLTLRVAVAGLIIGNVIMLLLLYIQERFHLIPLDADNYYIDFVPVKLSWGGILILNCVILFITYIVLLIPSRFVGTIKGTSAS